MMRLYNTLTRKKEAFKVQKQKPLELFVCGPTVYSSTHLGHARTYLAFDMIVKYLREKGCDVFYLQNITDIDDKIIQRAKKNKASPKEWARKFEKEYLQDMKSLKVDSVTKYARATDHIKEIIAQVKKLKAKGFAYQIKDGIYYDLGKFKDYGKLSRRTVLRAEDSVSRIDESKEKRNGGDFCLWKFSKSGEPKWRPAPVGRRLQRTSPGAGGSPSLRAGRPGWHIEDTAIAEKYFGSQYDIHGGGLDLIFPHHEAEIAQMEALFNRKPVVKYWLHTGFLTVNGQKMAKSLGNFITVKDFIKKYPARTLRCLVIKNHYRSPIDYNEATVIQAERELERIDEFVEKLTRSNLPNINIRRSDLNISKFKNDFELAMEDDFNAPKAMATIFELVNQGNSLMDDDLLSLSDSKNILAFLKEIDRFLNFIFWGKSKRKIPENVLNLLKLREEYRKKENWQKADSIRKKIIKLGWRIEDTPSGPKLKKTIESKKRSL